MTRYNESTTTQPEVMRRRQPILSVPSPYSSSCNNVLCLFDVVVRFFYVPSSKMESVIALCHLWTRYGMERRTNNGGKVFDATTFLNNKPNPWNIALSILHCIAPLMERSRVKLELLKFTCRLSLLTRQFLSPNNNDLLLLLEGGKWQQQQQEQPTILEQEQFRDNHTLWTFGRRTGRRIPLNGITSLSSQQHNDLYQPPPLMNDERQATFLLSRKKQQTAGFTTTLIGELLYVCRPLYWTIMQERYPQQQTGYNNNTNNNNKAGKRWMSLFKAWVFSFVMDIASHKLHSSIDAPHRHVVREERKRRKLRWMLYLLRRPIWNGMTKPCTDFVFVRILERVPMGGMCVARQLHYLLHYCQTHHFFMED